MRSKYNAKKITVDGIRFDSQKEYNRYTVLKLMEKSGVISNLQQQVKYELIPANRRHDGKLERAVNYYADFVYTQNGYTVVEDVKGFKTKEYVIKRKLMLDRYGIEIRET